MPSPARRHRLLLAAAAALAVAWSVRAPRAQEASPPQRAGIGWRLVHLDQTVDIEPEVPRFTVRGELTVRLDDLAESFGPSINLNRKGALLAWERLEVTGGGAAGAEVELGARHEKYPHARLAHVRFAQPKRRGDEVAMAFRFRTVANGAQLGVRGDYAMASWVEGWTPVPLPAGDDLNAGMLIAPGTTTLRMPRAWVGITDGVLQSRRIVDGRTVELWDASGVAAARSFVAGPFTVAAREAGTRPALVYRLSDHGPSADALAERMAQVIAALESKLGPFPAPSYGIVEAPDDLTDQWYAASQQTFVVAKSSAFDHDHGNTPLWAHESCHAWWGNLVGTGGPGAKMCGEALAQLGVLIALEATEGRDAMVRFLEFSRSGYSNLQCAAGYFHLLRDGVDHPLATLGASHLDGGQTHSLADSKGMWVWHMLRERIGDDVFFAVLRAIIAERRGGELTLDDLRAAFAAAAPTDGLDAFFGQWLDRPGAPVIDLDWWAVRTNGGERGARVVLTQRTETPFALLLEVEVELEHGEHVVQAVSVTEPETIVEIPTGSSRPVAVRLDPSRKALIWRPAYGRRPLGDGDDQAEAALPAAVRDAVVGGYTFGDRGPNATMIVRDGRIVAQFEGRADLPLAHQGDGVFHSAVPGRSATVVFDLSASPSPGFRLMVGDATHTARRATPRR